MKSPSQIARWVLLAAGLAATSACAFEALLTDDTSLALRTGSSNLGASPLLRVDGGYNALFKFDLGMLPSGTTAADVSVATLTVFINRVTKPGAIRLFRVQGAWTEQSVPVMMLMSLPDSAVAVIPANAKNSFVCFEVTSLVKSWISGTANDGLAIGVDPSGPEVSLGLDSKENTSGGHCAALRIELTANRAGGQAAQGPQGAAGPQGPQGPPGSQGPPGPNRVSGTYSDLVAFGNGGNSFGGSFMGNGAGLTNLSGANLMAGTVGSNALDSATKALLGSGSPLTGQIVSPATIAGNETESMNRAYARGHYAQSLRATQIVETWNDLSAWDVNGGQVANGRCYAANLGRGISRTFLLRADESMRVMAKYYFPDPPPSERSYLMIGVSSEPPGTAPTPDSNYEYSIKNFVGIGFYNDMGAVVPWLVDTRNVRGVYTVAWRSPGGYTCEREGTICIYVDTNSISFSLFSEGQTNCWTVTRTRASFPVINKIAICNSSSAGLSGPSIGLLGATKGTYSMDPRVEALGFYKMNTTNANGDGFSVMLPTNYNSSVACPVVLCLHGAGGNENTWPYLQNPDVKYEGFGGGTNYSAVAGNWEARATARMLLGAGYILASGKMGLVKPTSLRTDPFSSSEVDLFNGGTWGNDSAAQGVTNLIRFVRERFPVSHMVYYSMSMGGATAFRAIRDNVAEIDGFVGMAPVCNLGMTRCQTYPYLVESVTNAWTNAVPPAWAIITNQERSLYTETRMRLYASAGDSVVSTAENSLVVSNWLQGWTTNFSVYSTAEGVTGDHGEAGNYLPSDILDFFNNCIRHP